MQEREIKLIDLIVEILFHWRMFIVWMLCGAVLLGGLSYVRTWQSANAQAAQVEEAKRQLEAGSVQEDLEAIESTLLQKVTGQLTTLQRQNVEMVLAYEKWLGCQEDSALLQIDANNVQQAEITFFISSESQERSCSIEAVYEDIVAGGELAQYVEDRLGIPPHASAMISLQRDEQVRWESTNSFSVKVIHYDEQVCRDMAQAVIDFMKDKHDVLVKQLGEHEMKVVNSSYAVVYDTELADSQQTLINSMITAQDTVVKRKKDFSEQEWQYYDVLTNGEITGLNSAMTVPQSPQAIVERGVTVTPGISLKYMIFGLVLAAFVYAFYLFVSYVLNTKIRATDNLQQIYAVSQLGLVPAQNDRKKIFGFVDKWIDALRHRNKRKFTGEEALKLAATAVKMAAERNEYRSVYLVGCDLKDRSLQVCEQIRDRLNPDHIQAVILNNVLYDASAMKGLENAQGVVLVEKAGSTLYTEIEQELELLKREKIQVLGGVIVE